MRINRFLAAATGMSRRAADTAITNGRVQLNGGAPAAGADVQAGDIVILDGRRLKLPETTLTLILNKPVGLVCSRAGQGSRTVYDLLPQNLHRLKPVGRLDKDSSGLLLLTTDGALAHQLTHPRFHKLKVYEVGLDAPLEPLHRQMIAERGVRLEDGPSKFQLERLNESNGRLWRGRLREGRNRQIRRTFAALGYRVTRLHRTDFGEYSLGSLQTGMFRIVDKKYSS